MSAPFDVSAVRAQFPILETQVHGAPLVYLDNAASAQKPVSVIDAMRSALGETYANVHRGLHFLSSASTEKFEASRERVRWFLGAQSTDEIIFTSGGTDAFNLVASSFVEPLIRPGDEIILSVAEHHSNIVPWHFLRERFGAVLRWAPFKENGSFDIEAYKELFNEKTRFVALTNMSNVLGSGAGRDAADIAHDHGVKILFDGCQSAVHEPVDVTALDADFFVFTGHKVYGPTGIGVLYAKRALLEGMRPYRGGGEMIEVVTEETVTYNAPPHRFEAGTPPIAEAIGLGAAIDFMTGEDRADGLVHERALLAHAEEELRMLNWVEVYGKAPEKGAILAFNVDGAHPHDVSQLLDRSGVAVRAGHHCAQPLMKALGVSATARASFAMYNTHEEVEAFVRALRKAKDILG